MLKNYFLITIVLFLLADTTGYAQSDLPKMEVGAQFTLNRLRALTETDLGVGGRVTYNFTRNIAAEGEFNYFPGNLKVSSLTYSRSRLQGLFGIKAGWRSDAAGIFGKFRPGFIRFKGAPLFCTNFAPSLICTIATGVTEYATDVGGVFELYPSRHTVARFDLGDTIIRFAGPFPSDPASATSRLTSHNIQFTAGVGIRF